MTDPTPAKKAPAAKKARPRKAAAKKAPAASTPEEPRKARLSSGQLATYTYFDASRGAGGDDVTRVGVVVDVVDGKARMAWLDDVSDPIRLDDLGSL